MYFFTDSNLKKSKACKSSKTALDAWDEVAEKTSSVPVLIKAVANYRIIFKLIFPARHEAELLFHQLISFYLDSTEASLTADNIVLLFERHVLHLQRQAVDGAVPMTVDEMKLLLRNSQHVDINARVMTLERELKNKRKGTDDNDNDSGPNRKFIGTPRGGNGGARGGLQGQGRNNSGGVRLAYPEHNGVSYCINFNKTACKSAGPGMACSRKGKEFQHLCLKLVQGAPCGGPHSAKNCTK